MILGKKSKTIARYVSLALSIHQRISDEEQQKQAAYDAACQLVAQKNAELEKPIQEILAFTALLQQMPALRERLSQKAEDITRLFNDKSNHTVDEELVTVRYTLPRFEVDMEHPEHYRLTGEDNTALNIAIHPITFALFNQIQGGIPSVTKSLMAKEYIIKVEDEAAVFYSIDNVSADPIADMLTELRQRLGFQFFETEFLPYLKNNAGKQA
jgi:hypothetical protein